MKAITVSVNEFAHLRARALGLNISKICSDAIEAATPKVSQEDEDLNAWQQAENKAKIAKLEAAEAAIKAEKDAMVEAFRNAQTDEERAVFRAEMIRRGWIHATSDD